MLKQTRDTLDQAWQRGYLVCKRDQNALRNTFYNHCYNQGFAATIVESVRGNKTTADVSMDFTMGESGAPWIRTEAWMERMKVLIEEATGKLYTWNALPGSYTLAKKVPLENAETLAKSFVLMAREDWKTCTFPEFVPMPESKDLIRFHESQRTGIIPSKSIRDMAAWRFKCWQKSLTEE